MVGKIGEIRDKTVTPTLGSVQLGSTLQLKSPVCTLQEEISSLRANVAAVAAAISGTAARDRHKLEVAREWQAVAHIMDR